MLGPVYLGSLYACLDECVAKVARSLGRYDVVTYMRSSFLQMFLWEASRPGRSSWLNIPPTV